MAVLDRYTHDPKVCAGVIAGTNACLSVWTTTGFPLNGGSGTLNSSKNSDLRGRVTDQEV